MSRTSRFDNISKAISAPHLSFLYGIMVAFVLLAGSSVAQQPTGQPLAVPAQFVQRLTLPGEMNELLRPGRMFVDRHFGEVFVSDPGNNRVVIFDQNGVFRFEFYGSDLYGSAHDMVVDSKGYIYILGTTRLGHQLFKFDFDGTLVDTLDISGLTSTVYNAVSSIAIDADDNLYLVLPSDGRIVSLSSDGVERYRFPIAQTLDSKRLQEAVFGALTIDGDRAYLPISSMSLVEAYDLQGNLLKSFGIRGNLVGQFNFPVEVAVSKDGIIMVLDKHRFMVLCFDEQFRFLGEFGGKGFNPGWFYHPDKLVVDTLNQVYIGQVFNSWVQVVTIPDFITAKVALHPGGTTDLVHEPATDTTEQSTPNVEPASDGTPVVSMTP